MYLSFSARIILDAEALNMAESVGNYTRHRRAPLVVEASEGGYTIRYVPAISGESIAHAYQIILAELAQKKGLPVCKLCARGEFVKHATKELFAGEPWEKELEDAKGSEKGPEARHKIEKSIVEHCVVEDVGGFLYTEGQVRRTSRIWFSYALPSRAFFQAAALEPQLHTRISTIVTREEAKERAGEAKTAGQMLYYVEIGSAVYAISGMLDICNIGCTSLIQKECTNDADERRKVALEALATLLGSAWFGAKRSRFLPGWQIESAVFTLSERPFMATSAHIRDYIEDTVKRAKIVNAKVYYYATYQVNDAEKLTTIEELPNKITLKC